MCPIVGNGRADIAEPVSAGAFRCERQVSSPVCQGRNSELFELTGAVSRSAAIQRPPEARPVG
jgi:hypothetical protein